MNKRQHKKRALKAKEIMKPLSAKDWEFLKLLREASPAKQYAIEEVVKAFTSEITQVEQVYFRFPNLRSELH